jgi:sec-independent protein translocase protein TatA
MGAVSPTHLIIVLVVALLILGPGKLPETGEALGKAVRELRRAMADEPTGTHGGAATPES